MARPLKAAERPKLGARVDPWIKQALKIGAALETRTEEALVEDALMAYLFQRHPEMTSTIRAQGELSSR